MVATLWESSLFVRSHRVTSLCHLLVDNIVFPHIIRTNMLNRYDQHPWYVSVLITDRLYLEVGLKSEFVFSVGTISLNIINVKRIAMLLIPNEVFVRYLIQISVIAALYRSSGAV